MLDLRAISDCLAKNRTWPKMISKKKNGLHIYSEKALVDFDILFHSSLDKTDNSLGFRWLVLAVGFVGRGKLNF